ncbi:hypothetical protein [Metabacillus fastidiosus]|uniref:UPF0738 family protein n=1 Tax=Metabacillus fastidiosus TaxID=1458 RepID=UPI002E20D174|nr:hypothetical protein [Metabacillus fastidiosus]
MQSRITIKDAKIVDNMLVLQADQYENNENELQAKGQMLVDSDNLAFIYILETSEQYVYVGIPYTMWKQLDEAKIKELPVYVQVNNKQLELVNVIDELSFLLDNIKDNGNYGEELERKVVELFSL